MRGEQRLLDVSEDVVAAELVGVGRQPAAPRVARAAHRLHRQDRLHLRQLHVAVLKGFAIS